jgi:hypothetical protein
MLHSTMLDLPVLSARLRTTLDLSLEQPTVKTHFLQQDSPLAIWRTLAVRRDFADTAFELSPAGDILVRDEDPWHQIFKTDGQCRLRGQCRQQDSRLPVQRSGGGHRRGCRRDRRVSGP